MPAPTTKALRAAATSVAGARSMGVETAASKAAPALLADAHAWLRANISGAQFDRRQHDLSASAAELATAIGVPTLDQELSAARAARYAAEDAEFDRRRASKAAEEAANIAAHAAREWAEARESTVADRDDVRDDRGVAVAVVLRRRYTEARLGAGAVHHGGVLLGATTSVVAEDGRVLQNGEWASSPAGDWQVWGGKLHPAGAHGIDLKP